MNIRNHRWHLLVLVAILLIPACGSPPTPSESKFNAALLIEHKTTRNNAMIRCAKFASENGEVVVAIAAVARLDRDTDRDNTRYQCIPLLVAAGDFEGARKMANAIGNESMRRNALMTIISGE